MHRQSSTPDPRLWISSFSLLPSGGHTDCDCPGACPEPVGPGKSRSQIEALLSHVNSGAIAEVFLAPELFLETVGEYTVAVSATEEPVVVLDGQASQLLPFLGAPSTLRELKARFSDWGDGTLEQTIAVLLATGVLSSSSPPVNVEQQSSFAGESIETLTVWLHLTHQCNLSCKYCYVPRTNQSMDPYTARRSVEAVYRSAMAHNCERVRLKYAGGEPMLNLDALRTAHMQAERLSAQTGIGLETVVLTNGTLLTDDLLGFLLEHAIKVMVSLDGVGPYQDTQRPLNGRRGSSFKLIADALDQLLDQGLSPHVSVTITGQSLAGLPDLVEFLLDRQLQFSLNFYREPDGFPLSGPLGLTPPQTVSGLCEVFWVIGRKLPRHSLLSNLTDRADLGVRHRYACGAGHNYLVIDSDGYISKCQMDMAHPVTTVDADDPLAFVRADTNGIQNLAVDDKACRDCIWRYRCAGGCPRLTFQRTGRYGAQSPLCEVYRAILPEVVQLEALRLVRYEEPWDFGPPIN